MAPVDEHPDARVAREEIFAYYAERVAAAKADLEEALAEVGVWQERREVWRTTGAVPGDVVGRTDMEPLAIAGRSMDRYQRAASRAVDLMGPGKSAVELAEAMRVAEELGERDKALRRWLTAQGHDLGAVALPPPAEPPLSRRGGRRR